MRLDGVLERPGQLIGGWFSTPEATCTFCPCSAWVTSLAVRLRDCSRCGSSQIRIESRLPKTVMEPTPLMRVSGSLISSVAKLEMNDVSRERSGETRCTTIIRSGELLLTVTPILRTSAGKRPHVDLFGCQPDVALSGGSS